MTDEKPRTCPQCGAENSRRALECNECGAPLVLYMPGRARVSRRAIRAAVAGTAGLIALTAGFMFGGWPALVARFVALVAGVTALRLGREAARDIRRHGLRRTGRELAELGLVTGALAATLALATLPFAIFSVWRAAHCPPRQSAQVELRAVAGALEAYFTDHQSYPAELTALTTPAAYLPALPKDRFAPAAGAGYCYWRTPPDAPRTGWILWSAGPDRVYNLTPETAGRLYDPLADEPPPPLKALSYDPSNGTRSGGDIWRVRQ